MSALTGARRRDLRRTGAAQPAQQRRQVQPGRLDRRRSSSTRRPRASGPASSTRARASIRRVGAPVRAVLPLADNCIVRVAAPVSACSSAARWSRRWAVGSGHRAGPRVAPSSASSSAVTTRTSALRPRTTRPVRTGAPAIRTAATGWPAGTGPAAGSGPRVSSCLGAALSGAHLARAEQLASARRAPRRGRRTRCESRPAHRRRSASPRHAHRTVRSLGSTEKQMPWSTPRDVAVGRRQQVAALAVGVVDQRVEEAHRAQPLVAAVTTARRRRPPDRSRSMPGPCPRRTVRRAGPSAARRPSRSPRTPGTQRPRGGPACRSGKSSSGRSPLIGL